MLEYMALANSDLPIADKQHSMCDRALEDIPTDTNRLYWITWNPKPVYYINQPNGFNRKTCTYDDDWIRMLDLLMTINRASKYYCITPEVSDNGKLHCHGWFVMTDKIKWIKSVYPTLYRNGMIRTRHCKVQRDDFDSYMRQEFDDTLTMFRDPKLFVLSHLTYKYLKTHINAHRIMLSNADGEQVLKKKAVMRRKDIADYFGVQETELSDHELDESMQIILGKINNNK